MRIFRFLFGVVHESVRGTWLAVFRLRCEKFYLMRIIYLSKRG